MGHKINPVFFRLGVSLPQLSSWYTNKLSYSHFLLQDLELRKFLFELLKAKGILIRFCNIERSYNKTVITLDLYISYLLSKQAKFVWARGLFKSVKKKYIQVNKIADIRSFILNGSTVRMNFVKSKVRRKKNFFFQKKQVAVKLASAVVNYRTRLFFFFVQKGKQLDRREETKFLSGHAKLRRSTYFRDCAMVRLRLKKFNRIFVLDKFRYNFRQYVIKKNLFGSKLDLFELNRALSKSILNFLGNEEVKLNIISTQLNYLPMFKNYQKLVIKDLFRFQRNRNLSRFFMEVLEVLFLAVKTFGFGNAFLLGQLLVFLLENSRKQLIIIKFLKKVLQVLFQVLPREELAVNGIKVLIKGRFEKRRRTKKLLLQEGEMPLQTISAPLDYFQTQAVTIYGTFGVKVWISKRLV